MNLNPDSLNYRGNYRQYDSRGYEQVYYVGDVVLYDGKQYIAIANTSRNIPTKINSGWKLLTTDVDGYYYSDSVPLNANVGDRWVDMITGRMYTYIEDKNGFHWIEF
jgi:hypothetical protein